MTVDADNDTLLVITGLDIPRYAARGLTQTLEPIPAAANMRRTVNGALASLAPAQFQKYKSRISCTDLHAPSLDGVFPGLIVTVDCVEELSFLTLGNFPLRPDVPGSTRIDGDRTFYRPRLEMMVIQWSASRPEWEATDGWTLDLEEV